MTKRKKNWADISTAAMTEDAVRALHQPPENFKVYVNTHEAGKTFSIKAGHAFTLYILTGNCKTLLDGVEVTLAASEWATLQQGAYAFEVTSDDELKLMKVFSLSY